MFHDKKVRVCAAIVQGLRVSDPVSFIVSLGWLGADYCRSLV